MSILSFLLFVFVTSFTPGPNTIMAMLFANKYGLKKTIRFCLGVGTGFFLIMILCIYLNVLLKSILPKIELLMTILGVMYMLYLALKIMMAKNVENDTEEQKDNNNFISGILLQFINPKGILFALSVVSTFILPYDPSHLALLFYSLLLAFIGFVSTFCWSLFGSLFQKYLSAFRKQFNIIMGSLLIVSVLSILIK
ncbi:LysE family translocator [Niallia sp. 01092]|uniref:LysE family translocator n=1 Tax=unclassified Niallia TaxID=2837522 RepID=UPI003FD0E4BE